MIWLFRIGVAVDILAILFALYTIVTDAIKNPSSSKNGVLALVTLLGVGWLVFSYYLKSVGKINLAALLVWIPGVPILLTALFLLLLIVLKPDWK